MARGKVKTQTIETPSDQFDRVTKRVAERDRKARTQSRDQPSSLAWLY